MVISKFNYFVEFTFVDLQQLLSYVLFQKTEITNAEASDGKYNL